VTGGDLHVAQVSASIKHGRDVCMAEHMRMRPGDLDAGGFGQPVQAPGGGVPVHPGAAAVEQDRPADPGGYGPVDGPDDRGRQRDQEDLGALAAHAQDPVAVVLAEVGDVRGGGFEDPQAQQAEHAHQREIARVRRLPGGGEQGLELQVGEPQGRDSAGTAGRRACSAGECSRMPSRTQVR